MEVGDEVYLKGLKRNVLVTFKGLNDIYRVDIGNGRRIWVNGYELTKKSDESIVEIKDNELRVFPSGAKRSSNKGKSRPDLISPYFSDRLGIRLAEGANFAGDRNWEKGIPDSAAIESLERHLIAIKQKLQFGYSVNYSNEDHEGGAAFNLMVLIHNQEIRKLPGHANYAPEPPVNKHENKIDKNNHNGC